MPTLQLFAWVLPSLLLAVPAANAADATRQLKALLDEDWRFQLAEEPVFATLVGEHRYDDRLASVTPADFARRAAFGRRMLSRLDAIDPKALSPKNRLDAALFRRHLVNALEELRFRTWRAPINAEGGFHSSFARLPSLVPFATARDYENYVARLRAFPAFARQHTENLREGLRTGFAQPNAILKGFEATISAHLVGDPEQSVFWKPFAELPGGVSDVDRAHLRQAGRQAIADDVLPAYRAFLEFMTKEYLPGARDTVGASELPEGREYYAYCVRRYTTLDVTPDEVHELGLREVARIRAEMDELLRRLEWHRSFAEFLEFLRSDPRFYPKSAEELLQRASFIAKKMDGQLPRFFKTLPRQPYGVEPVPADVAPSYTAGRYEGAPIESRRAGMYWVNTYALSTRTLYTLEALTLHEAVPGHHLQTSLQQEQRDVPAFRRYDYVDAFGEGWGLYAERLGLEAGFYGDPYSNFGRLTYEMWRACRLVVDTGLHAKGWTREQALRYLAEHTALSLHEVTTETDRYIGWPGQALAYKMGELKIRALRERAERELGPRFDVREFHEAVLENGSVPLALLEAQVDAYIAAAKKANAS